MPAEIVESPEAVRVLLWGSVSSTTDFLKSCKDSLGARENADRADLTQQDVLR